jgi:hypothetical protein
VNSTRRVDGQTAHRRPVVLYLFGHFGTRRVEQTRGPCRHWLTNEQGGEFRWLWWNMTKGKEREGNEIKETIGMAKAWSCHSIIMRCRRWCCVRAGDSMVTYPLVFSRA